tara:strand:- start:239 stop:592 length:354 start_codon:yes stop_codon:yes gene_type:complete
MKNKKIKILIKEYGGMQPTHGPGARFIHMGDDYRHGDRPTAKDDMPQEEVLGDAIPQPRNRVPHPEDYNKVYALLLGQPAAATGLSLEEIMKQVGSSCPNSSAQAVTDYLSDRARIS